MKRYVIGIDQGTTGTHVALMNAGGDTVSSAYKPHEQFYPHPGWVEQDPEELWQNAFELLNRVIDASGVGIDEIAGIGIANQGESVVAWDRKTGEPLSRVLVWQDTRTQADLERLSIDRQEIAARTGLKLDSYFSASKIRWILDELPGADRLACGTLDSWLIWKLTAGQSFVTDVSTASRTLLFNIHTRTWDDWLLEQFDIPAEILPEVRATTAHFGDVAHPDLRCRGVPIVASLVDQPAAMVGHGCLDAGQIKATYGTGCFVNLNTGSELVMSQHGLLTMLAWERDGHPVYGLDGGVFTAAATLNWMKRDLQLFQSLAEIDSLCARVSGFNSVMWIPAQTGLGAPYWDRSIRGAWLGIDLGTGPAHLLRAVLEGISARVAQIARAMLDDTGLSIGRLRVDGGLTNSASMMQIQADMLGYPVEVVANAEATTSGVCGLAARASGLWGSDERINEMVHISHVYEPGISEDERTAYLDRFDQAIQHMKAWQRGQ